MPLIVDKDEMKMQILMAFQRCIKKKPLTSISLRDVAVEAEMSHPSLLHYFKSKDEMVLSYAHYTCDFISSKCETWFGEHSRNNYVSNLAYMNAFMQYVADGKPEEVRPNATVQLYVMAHYNDEVAKLVASEFQAWRQTMLRCLIEIYGEKVGKAEAEAMMILISGVFICNYNNALTGAINDNIMGYLSSLSGQTL